MKNSTLAFILIILLSCPGWAQDSNTARQRVGIEVSDPAAKAVLDELRQKYESYNSLQAEFSLEIKFPNQQEEIQYGTLNQRGEQYRLTMASQTVISDGEALYLILHNNEEVQINDLPEEGEDQNILSPQNMLGIYQSDDFLYALTDERMEDGRLLQFIEFKPTDESSDYFKIRLVVDKSSKQIVRVLAFARDGSRYAFRIDKLQPNVDFPPGYFEFDKSEYPDYYVEDLRY
ncbi:MAG: outer membrane lipoprotein carrier protein LolA [Saprospiraceae bacterium]|nr:outer membrane lipoprotein carrier protein LolA [Saprospiraceae bacterium]